VMAVAEARSQGRPVCASSLAPVNGLSRAQRSVWQQLGGEQQRIHWATSATQTSA
jgi:ABC-type hemin transport system ATPase subunit